MGNLISIYLRISKERNWIRLELFSVTVQVALGKTVQVSVQVGNFMQVGMY